MGKYDDIINLPHHESDYHKRMPMANRAAQFAPFAALSGHSEAIEETRRITESFKELSEEEKQILSRKLNFAIEHNSSVEITYFLPDKTKSGGTYKRTSGRINRWDEFDNILILREGNFIKIDHISEIKIKDGNVDF